MSCPECSLFQHKENATSFYTFQDTIIEIRACPRHIKRVTDALTTWQDWQDKKTNEIIDTEE